MKTLCRWILATAIFAYPTAVPSASWEDAIGAVEKKISAYYDYAIKLDPQSMPGTALQGLGYDQNICAIVGRMLGFVEEIREAETLTDPEMRPDADPFVLMEHSMVLDSWVAAARNALSLTDVQRKNLWNFQCVGKFGIPASARIVEPDLLADFSVKDTQLYVYGDIDSGFFDRFLLALDANPDIDEVLLGSAGGSVRDALLSGNEIRRRGLATTLFGPCYSACPLIFVGGQRRSIWMGPGPHLGFHMVYTKAGAIPMSDSVYGAIGHYLDRMGVNSIAVISWMASAGPEEMFEPDLDAICQANVATWVQRMCLN